MGEHKTPKKKISTNVRIRIVESDELKGLPTIAVAVPSDPTDLTQTVMVSAVMEIFAPDPFTGKPDWFMVPIISDSDTPDQPEPSLIQVARPMGKH